jgi:hypothetical protein
MHTNEVIVRWGLAEPPGLLEEAGMKRPFTVASERWSHLDLHFLAEPARAVSIPTHSAQFCDAAVSISSTALTIRGRS